MDTIKKRNGDIVPFNPEKIHNAMRKAFIACGWEADDESLDGFLNILTKRVVDRAIASNSDSVEQIQDHVEMILMEAGEYRVAKAYVEYRYSRSLARKSNTTDESILSLLRDQNKELKEENSNKSTVIASTQRDYIAGEVSRDLSRRILLPQHISKAHDEGILHFHDMDYFVQPIFNCFRRDTRFITGKGIQSFNEFNDGDDVVVFNKDGNYCKATVRCYGEQTLNEITFKNKETHDCRIIRATANHRWILKDESVTTSLKAGDELYPNGNWFVDRIIIGTELKDVWCVEEPATHSFTLEGGIVTGNCCLINIGDMLDNGTVMNGRMIETPKSFQVACTVMTQIVATVASNQYGGQSVDLSHLGKYLRRSRDKLTKRFTTAFPDMSQDDIAKLVDIELKEELKSGVQTIQYQINSLMTTNGQSPFVTLFLNLAKDDPYIEENAMIIEEVLKQRLQGIKNECGVYTTPAFPKLVYVLDDWNNLTGGKYDYITKLACKCTAKRMYPDYISAKKMRENYEGNVFSPMGCRSFLAPWKDENGKYKFEGRLTA